MIVLATDRSGNAIDLEVSSGDTLMEALRDAGLGIEAVCGGSCACATCHVYVSLAVVGQRGEVEDELVQTSAHFRPEASRLSCQIVLREELDGLVVTVAPEE